MSDPRQPNDGGTPPSEPQDDLDPDPALGDLDDEPPEPDAEPDEPEDDQPDPDEPPPPQTRRQRQEGNRAELERQRTENAELRGRLAALEQQRQPPPDPQAQQRALEAEYERISLLNPVEQEAARHALYRRDLAQQAAVSAERSDVAAFAQLQTIEPAARRLATQVEQTVAQLRSQGITGINREGIYNYLLGQEMRQRASREGTRQRRNGEANVRRQTTRPGSGRSGVAATPGGRGREQSADDERLLRGTRVSDVM